MEKQQEKINQTEEVQEEVSTRETQKEQPGEASAPEGRKPKKKPLVIAGIVIGILLALGIGAGVIYARNTPERRLERQLELGQKYLEEMDYEQAVAAYRAALEIDPRSTEAYLGGIRACDGMGDGAGLEEFYAQALSAVEELEPEQLEAQLENVVQIVVYADKAYPEAPEQAVAALERGHELTGENAQVTDALVDGYLNLAELLQTEKDYEGELSLYDTILELRPENETALEQRKDRVEEYLEELIAGGELDKAQEFIDKYKDVVSDVDFEGYTEQVTTGREVLQARDTMMKKLYGFMTAGDYPACAEVDGSEEARGVVEALEGQSCLYTEEGRVTDYTGKAVGLHPFGGDENGNYGYYFYYGDYVDGRQEGQGTYFISGSNYYELYEGSWQGGKPNGSGTFTRYERESEEEEYGSYYVKEEKGTFRDGVYDGTFAVSLKGYDGETYTGSFTADNGSVSDVFDQYKERFYDYEKLWEDHEAGRIIYCVMENPDTSWIWWSRMDPGNKLYITGFEE